MPTIGLMSMSSRGRMRRPSGEFVPSFTSRHSSRSGGQPPYRCARMPETPPTAPAVPAPEPSARPSRRVHLGLLVAQLCFGGFHVVGKAELAAVPPLALAAIRVGCAAPLMAVLPLRHHGPVPARRDPPLLAPLGSVRGCGHQAPVRP